MHKRYIVITSGITDMQQVLEECSGSQLLATHTGSSHGGHWAVAWCTDSGLMIGYEIAECSIALNT